MRAVTREPEAASSPRLSDVAEPGSDEGDVQAFEHRPDDVTVVLEPGGSR
jgi:hypothetical protein